MGSHLVTTSHNLLAALGELVNRPTRCEERRFDIQLIEQVKDTRNSGVRSEPAPALGHYVQRRPPHEGAVAVIVEGEVEAGLVAVRPKRIRHG